ncbi:Branched-chain amino acid transport protein (AzlD) [Moraxella cuniculi DSM 21768]|uniref:Branched-chain amino acid transport protein (AzlD) n=2 Tax=Moraxella cuniculi TaxID=34061 RepID=A0A1N7E3K8_9GAMM|nr:AzlD domain-containing protein [Moraxella cuniculi]OOS04652.1 hypothetical protein B0189_08300 [Moraxella cuniculi]SIR82616.1 Branched-chain amino acid transport protein (AzlD) [Moraxella cuniculi DSM 21768]VEG12876.1 Branched-chain amino acid transport protein (AzlD) [Moraxella cuniculi]
MANFTFLLVFSAITIFIFRVFPFLFKNNKYLNDKDSFLYKSISYSAQAMIGLIVFNSAFSGKNLTQLVETADVKDLIKLLFLILTFVITIKTKKIIPSFLFFLVVYGLIVYFLG